MVPRHVGKPLRLCPNKTNKTHNYKTLPRPSANTRDRAPLSRRRVSVLTCARYEKDAPRDCGSMKLLDPTGREFLRQFSEPRLVVRGHVLQSLSVEIAGGAFLSLASARALFSPLLGVDGGKECSREHRRAMAANPAHARRQFLQPCLRCASTVALCLGYQVRGPGC